MEPSQDILERPAPPADVRIQYGADPLQFGDLRLPSSSGPYPVVLALHGGYWRAQYGLEYMGHICTAMTSAGLATWNVEYRRLGNSSGGWPGTFEDVARAADFLRTLADQYPLDLTRAVAIGHSAGGHLACWLAGRHRLPPADPLHSAHPFPLTGVVSLAGVLDLQRAWELHLSGNVVETFLGGTPTAYPERYATASPLALLPLGVPQTLPHGTEDASVPYEISERYARRARDLGDDVELITLPATGHFELVDPLSPQWQIVLDAIRRAAGV